ncbi:hypothetical protein HN803_08465 [candidate division WWE3 bacterium]|nr:hypothetical protein [candidate division WWE3 bacterium]
MKNIATSCYIPLLRTIKNKRIPITLNIPLSLLEQMDRYGYKEWLADLKTLVEAEKVELVGSGAYHPLFSKIPTDFAEKQIILNEYALGYYFGKRGGFDGDPSIMIPNLEGFFSPELAVSMDVLKIIDDLGYVWMLVDETSIPKDVGNKRHGVFEVEGFKTRVVARNKKLSELIANKRDLEVRGILQSASSAKSSVVSINGEIFGHHNERGILLLETLFDALKKERVEVVTVSEYVKTKDERQIQGIVESTWNTSQENTDSGNLYPRWVAPKNKINKLQWEVMDKLLSLYKSETTETSLIGLEEIPVWDIKELEKIEDQKLRESMELDLLVLKSMHSCQFYQTSYEPVHSPGIIFGATALLATVVSKMGNAALDKYAKPRLDEINELVEASLESQN